MVIIRAVKERSVDVQNPFSSCEGTSPTSSFLGNNEAIGKKRLLKVLRRMSVTTSSVFYVPRRISMYQDASHYQKRPLPAGVRHRWGGGESALNLENLSFHREER